MCVLLFVNFLIKSSPSEGEVGVGDDERDCLGLSLGDLKDIPFWISLNKLVFIENLFAGGSVDKGESDRGGRGGGGGGVQLAVLPSSSWLEEESSDVSLSTSLSTCTASVSAIVCVTGSSTTGSGTSLRSCSSTGVGGDEIDEVAGGASITGLLSRSVSVSVAGSSDEGVVSGNGVDVLISGRMSGGAFGGDGNVGGVGGHDGGVRGGEAWTGGAFWVVTTGALVALLACNCGGGA